MRLLAGIAAVWLVGCGSDFEVSPRAATLVGGEDAGPGAGGALMVRPVGTGGAVPAGAGGAAGADGPAAGGAATGYWAPCTHDADCTAGWKCAVTKPRESAKCLKPCTVGLTNNRSADCRGVDDLCVPVVNGAVEDCPGPLPRFCADWLAPDSCTL